MVSSPAGAQPRTNFKKTFDLPESTVPLIAILAYFSGWWYRNEFFSDFGIPRSSFTTADYTIFVHAYSVLSAARYVIHDWDVIKHLSVYVAFLISARWLISVPNYLIHGYAIAMRKWLTHRLNRNAKLGRKTQYLLYCKARRWRTILGKQHVRVQKVLVLVVRVLWWVALFNVAFVLSREAGSIDAEMTLQYPRTVQVLFSKSAYNELPDRPDVRSDEMLREIQRESRYGNIALIWRSSYETIIVQLEDGFCPGESWDETKCKTFRIDNDYIVGVIHDDGQFPIRRIARD